MRVSVDDIAEWTQAVRWIRAVPTDDELQSAMEVRAGEGLSTDDLVIVDEELGRRGLTRPVKPPRPPARRKRKAADRWAPAPDDPGPRLPPTRG